MDESRPQPPRTRSFRARVGFWLLDAALVALLLAWGWFYFRPLETLVNIELYDETGDLWRALRQPLLNWPPEYGPLYPLWYRFLSWFDPEPLRLYFHSYRWVGMLTPVALYIALRRVNVVAPMAFWVSGMLLMSQGHALLWPRITVFWALVLASALAVVGWHPRRPWWMQWVHAGWVLWWSAYVRPEFWLPAVVTLLLGLALGWRRRFEGFRRAWMVLWLSAAVPLLLWGMPYRPGRLHLAFSQHFIVNRAKLGDPIEDPWVETWRIREYFSRPDSLLAMLQERPDLIWEHIRCNEHRLQTLPERKKPWALSRRWRFQNLFYPMLGLGLVGAWTRRKRLLRDFPLLFLALVAVFVPLFSALWIYPHPHYLYVAWVGFLLGWALLVGRDGEIWRSLASRRMLYGLSVLGVLVLAWTMFGRRTLEYWIPAPKDPARRVASVARFVRSLHLPRNRTIYALGVDGEWFVYFGPQFQGLDDAFRDSNMTLHDFLEKYDVGLIALGEQRLCRRDPATCQALRENPEAFGYVRLDVPLADGGTYPLLVREDLLREGNASP